MVSPAAAAIERRQRSIVVGQNRPANAITVSTPFFSIVAGNPISTFFENGFQLFRVDAQQHYCSLAT